jgi:Flp pilus assembly protein CpaB
MKKYSRLLVLLPFCCILACIFLFIGLMAFHGFVETFLRQSPPVPARTPILVAAFDIREGERILSVHLRTTHIGQALATKALIVSGQERLALGREARMDIPKGTPIFKSALRPPSPKSGT